MDWQVVGALAETIAAVGVIISLLYLAIQIRAGARATRRTNAHELNKGHRDLWALISQDEETAQLWQKGLKNHGSLTPVEALRFSTLMLQVVIVWEELFYAAKDMDVPEWAGTASRVGQREIVSLPGFQSWYEVRGHWLSPEFRDSLERDMEAGVKSVAPFYSRASEG